MGGFIVSFRVVIINSSLLKFWIEKLADSSFEAETRERAAPLQIEKSFNLTLSLELIRGFKIASCYFPLFEDVVLLSTLNKRLGD